MKRLSLGASGAKNLCALGAMGRRFCAAPSTSPLKIACYVCGHPNGGRHGPDRRLLLREDPVPDHGTTRTRAQLPLFAVPEGI